MTAAPAQPSAGAQFAALARPTRTKLKHAPWQVVVLLITMMLPSEVSFMVGALRLSPYRVLLLVLFIPAVLRLFSGRAGRVVLPDILMTCFVLWAALAVIIHHGFGEGIEKGGIFAVESLGGYLVARVWVTDIRKFKASVKAFVYTVIGSLIWTIPESLLHIHFAKSFFATIFGGGFSSGIDRRMGVTRAFGTFDHPILNGVYCASALGMAYYVLARREVARTRDVFRGGLVILAAFTSMSSGAIAAVSVQLGLIVYERLTRMIGLVKGRWWILVGAVLGNYVAIDALSNRTGMHVLLSYLTFSPGTAYNRLMIWDFGTAEVRRYPFFGIGFGEWERPSWMSGSMDNFWLVNAVRYGLPAFICLAASVLLLMRSTGQGIRSDAIPEHRLARRGWLVSMIAVSVAGCTVHFWNSISVHFFMLVGLGPCLAWSAKEGAWVRSLKQAAATEHAQNAPRAGSESP